MEIEYRVKNEFKEKDIENFLNNLDSYEHKTAYEGSITSLSISEIDRSRLILDKEKK